MCGLFVIEAVTCVVQDDLTCPMGWSGVAPGVSFHAPQRLMLGWITQNSAFLKTAVHPNIFP